MTEQEQKRWGVVPVGTGAGSLLMKPDERPIRPPSLLAAWKTLTPVQAVGKFGHGPKLIFPDRVLLTIPDRMQVSYPAGVHEVPESLASHRWLKLCGVHAPEVPPVRPPVPVLTGKEVGRGVFSKA